MTRDSYDRIQDTAKAMGILDGVAFHREAMADEARGHVGAGLHV